MTRPGVVMVTGAYYPELSGAGLQCRCLVRALGDRADCAILTTSTLTGPAPSEIDGVPVERVPVRIGHPASEVAAGVRLAVGLARLGRRREIVHFHGFSRKSVPLMALARLLGKRRIVKLTSVGHDDPVSIIARGGAIAAAYRQADMYIAVSPGQRDLCIEAGIARDRFRLVPNGVDLERFRPAKPGEREAVRQELGLRVEGSIVLFVGFFSREKQPDVLFEAWRQRGAASSTLVFVGATRSQYYEVDPTLAERIRADAGALRERIVFVERTEAIEKYYRVADVFALPSSREGLPNVLLEAMASGLACIASRLPGVTDAMLDDGVTGRLVPPGDVETLSAVLAEFLADADLRARMGAAARRMAIARYSVEACADAHLDVYGRLIRL